MPDLSDYLCDYNSIPDPLPFCLLPGSHTLEAEMYGAHIRFDGGPGGPRAGEFLFSRAGELRGLPSMNVSLPRLSETLAACRKCKEQGRTVVFQISGPFTILGCLLPSVVLFRAMVKERELMMDVFGLIGRDLIPLMKLAEDAGADIISYADPTGAPGILGPRLSNSISERFTAGLLSEADRVLKPETLVLLCPKTAAALTGAGLFRWRDHPLPGPLSYVDAALSLRGTVRFGGQSCIKKTDSRHAVFRELVTGGDNDD